MSDIAHQVTVSSGQSWFSHAAYVLRENPITALAFGLFFLLLVLALFGSALAPYDPQTGQYLTPDGQLHQVTNLAAGATPKTWKDLLPI